MKVKYLYILFSIVASLFFTGCSEEDILQPEQSKDNKVLWKIGVALPEPQSAATRAFDRDDFTFEDLYVAVFAQADGVYFLDQFVRADATVPTWNETNQCWDFGIELTKTETHRRLHLIANYPGLTMGFGEESQLIGRLMANGNNHDVYWNYVDIDKIDEGYEMQVQRVPLIRNFAQVKVALKPAAGVNLSAKFQLIGYAICNLPTRGTVAPYNSTNGSFANYVKTVNGAPQCQTYENLYEVQKYEGNEPYDNDGTLLSKISDFVTPDKPFYMYERSNRTATSPTSMIIKGKYAPDGKFDAVSEKYYKLDFIYVDEETKTNVYYNILRNLIYTINLTDVTGEGYETIDKAIEQPASNNIAGDASINDYTNISDGKSRLFVSTTYLVFTDNKPVDVYFQHLDNIEVIPNTIDNSTGVGGSVVVNAPTSNVEDPEDGCVLKNVTIAPADETVGHVGWRKITLTPHTPNVMVERQVITIATEDLQRQIVLVLRNPYEMSVNVSPKLVEKKQKEPLVVKFTIPGGIPSALFPLKFFISTDKNTIDPKPGTNMPAEAKEGTYGFIKEISYNQYTGATTTGDGKEVAIKESDGRVSFVTEFRTNCTESATDVYVDNEYFKRGVDAFDNEWKKSVSIGNTINVDIQKNNGRYPERTYKSGANNGTQTVSFTYNGNPYTITIDNDNVTNGVTLQNNAGIDPSTKLTFTFSDKYYAGRGNWSSQPVTYTATCTIRQLIAGTTLNFTATTPVDIVAAIDANVGVEIQKLNSRYPQTIANGNNKEVTIKIGDIKVGTVNINSNSVTTKPIELINDNGIKDSDVLTFTFSDKYYVGRGNWSDQPVTYTATCTVAQLKSGTTLMFNAPSGIKTTVLEITKDNFSGVTVQQDNGAYPRNIFNGNNYGQYYYNPQNNGTETVTVSYNNVDVGSITINSNSVTAITNGSIEISINDLDDKIVFRFTDYYCNSNWNNYTYNFSDEAEYSTKEFTLEELINGKIELNFTRK